MAPSACVRAGTKEQNMSEAKIIELITTPRQQELNHAKANAAVLAKYPNTFRIICDDRPTAPPGLAIINDDSHRSYFVRATETIDINAVREAMLRIGATYTDLGKILAILTDPDPELAAAWLQIPYSSLAFKQPGGSK